MIHSYHCFVKVRGTVSNYIILIGNLYSEAHYPFLINSHFSHHKRANINIASFTMTNALKDNKFMQHIEISLFALSSQSFLYWLHMVSFGDSESRVGGVVCHVWRVFAIHYNMKYMKLRMKQILVE